MPLQACLSAAIAWVSAVDAQEVREVAAAPNSRPDTAAERRMDFLVFMIGFVEPPQGAARRGHVTVLEKTAATSRRATWGWRALPHAAMRRVRTVLSLLLAMSTAVVACRTVGSSSDGAPAVAWQSWGADSFATAKRSGRLVLLDLGTNWCHWCHVMERETYGDPGVRELLAEHFVAIAEDADRRLDLAARYGDYGWPATIVLDGSGRELWKNRGYVSAEGLLRVLERLVTDPTPIDSVAATPTASSPATEATFAVLRERMDALYDVVNGGFGDVHKYVDADAIEWLVAAARSGDTTARDRVMQTLDAEHALLDPVWGGAFQYSHGGVWTNPHFEKVMSRQLADLRACSLAFAAFGRDVDLAAARSVARYLTTMLASPEGAFFASQDADVVPGEHAADYFAMDDAGRRARGLPRIERSVWSRENGQAIRGLCALLAVDRDAALLQRTVAAASWIRDHRRRTDGTFAHGDTDEAGPFLADSLEMAAAFRELGEVTGDANWLRLAVATVDAIDTRFAATSGYATAIPDGPLPPVVLRDENVHLARLANVLAATTSDATCRRVADRAFAHVTTADVALEPGVPADLLLLAAERDAAPVHVVVVGAAGDRAADELFTTVLRHAASHRIVERVEPGAEAADGTTFPGGDTAAAFVCSNGACSAPIMDVAALQARLRAR